MPRKTNLDKNERGRRTTMESRTPRPKPKIDFTVDALDYKNTTLLRQFVTDQGRILPRKYTGLPAHYQRQLNRSVKRARARGLDVSHIHVRHVWPMPNNLGDLLRGYGKILVPEMNTGQFKTVLRDQFLVDAKPLNKTSGQPFTIAELEAAIEAQLG